MRNLMLPWIPEVYQIPELLFSGLHSPMTNSPTVVSLTFIGHALSCLIGPSRGRSATRAVQNLEVINLGILGSRLTQAGRGLPRGAITESKLPGNGCTYYNTILKTSTALVCVRSQPFTRRTGLCTGGSTRWTRGLHETGFSTS